MLGSSLAKEVLFHLKALLDAEVALADSVVAQRSVLHLKDFALLGPALRKNLLMSASDLVGWTQLETGKVEKAEDVDERREGLPGMMLKMWLPRVRLVTRLYHYYRLQ